MSRSKADRRKQRELDLSGIHDDEFDQILNVIQRDISVRESEKARLTAKQQDVYQADHAAHTLRKLAQFTADHCMRCFCEFFVLINPRYICFACHYNVCKRCSAFNKKINAHLCTVCDKEKDILLQKCDWFYDSAKKRFKHFGSAKVVRALHKASARKHSMRISPSHGSIGELQQERRRVRQSRSIQYLYKLTRVLLRQQDASDNSADEAQSDVEKVRRRSSGAEELVRMNGVPMTPFSVNAPAAERSDMKAAVNRNVEAESDFRATTANGLSKTQMTQSLNDVSKLQPATAPAPAPASSFDSRLARHTIQDPAKAKMEEIRQLHKMKFHSQLELLLNELNTTVKTQFDTYQQAKRSKTQPQQPTIVNLFGLIKTPNLPDRFEPEKEQTEIYQNRIELTLSRFVQSMYVAFDSNSAVLQLNDQEIRDLVRLSMIDEVQSFLGRELVDSDLELPRNTKTTLDSRVRRDSSRSGLQSVTDSDEDSEEDSRSRAGKDGDARGQSLQTRLASLLVSDIVRKYREIEGTAAAGPVSSQPPKTLTAIKTQPIVLKNAVSPRAYYGAQASVGSSASRTPVKAFPDQKALLDPNNYQRKDEQSNNRTLQRSSSWQPGAPRPTIQSNLATPPLKTRDNSSASVVCEVYNDVDDDAQEGQLVSALRELSALADDELARETQTETVTQPTSPVPVSPPKAEVNNSHSYNQTTITDTRKTSQQSDTTTVKVQQDAKERPSTIVTVNNGTSSTPVIKNAPTLIRDTRVRARPQSASGSPRNPMTTESETRSTILATLPTSSSNNAYLQKVTNQPLPSPNGVPPPPSLLENSASKKQERISINVQAQARSRKGSTGSIIAPVMTQSAEAALHLADTRTQTATGPGITPAQRSNVPGRGALAPVALARVPDQEQRTAMKQEMASHSQYEINIDDNVRADERRNELYSSFSSAGHRDRNTHLDESDSDFASIAASSRPSPSAASTLQSNWSQSHSQSQSQRTATAKNGKAATVEENSNDRRTHTLQKQNSDDSTASSSSSIDDKQRDADGGDAEFGSFRNRNRNKNGEKRDSTAALTLPNSRQLLNTGGNIQAVLTSLAVLHGIKSDQLDDTNDGIDNESLGTIRKVTAFEGDSAAVQCTVQTSKAHVSWYKLVEKNGRFVSIALDDAYQDPDKYEFTGHSQTPTARTFSFTLHVNFVSRSNDAGYYVAVVQAESNADARGRTEAFELVVMPAQIEFKAPSFIEQFAQVDVAPCAAVHFYCKLSGSPLPIVRFFKDGRALQFANGCCGNAKLTQINNRAYRLTIEHVTEKDDAEYGCYARNCAGTTRCAAMLTVQRRQDAVLVQSSNLPRDNVVLERTFEKLRRTQSQVTDTAINMQNDALRLSQMEEQLNQIDESLALSASDIRGLASPAPRRLSTGSNGADGRVMSVPTLTSYPNPNPNANPNSNHNHNHSAPKGEPLRVELTARPPVAKSGAQLDDTQMRKDAGSVSANRSQDRLLITAQPSVAGQSNIPKEEALRASTVAKPFASLQVNRSNNGANATLTEAQQQIDYATAEILTLQSMLDQFEEYMQQNEPADGVQNAPDVAQSTPDWRARHSSSSSCRGCTYDYDSPSRTNTPRVLPAPAVYLRSFSVPPSSDDSTSTPSNSAPVPAAGAQTAFEFPPSYSSSSSTAFAMAAARPINVPRSYGYAPRTPNLNFRDELHEIAELDNEAYENLAHSESWHSLRGDLSKLMRRSQMSSFTVNAIEDTVNSLVATNDAVEDEKFPSFQELRERYVKSSEPVASASEASKPGKAQKDDSSLKRVSIRVSAQCHHGTA